MPSLVTSPVGALDSTARASGMYPEALFSGITPAVDAGGGFFSTLWQVCKVAFGVLIGLGVIVEAINFISKLVTLCSGEKKEEKIEGVPQKPQIDTMEKTKGAFLSGVNLVGGSAALLNWCHHSEWIDLGPTLGPITFIGYPVTLITSSFAVVDHIREIKALSQIKNDPEVDQKKKAAILNLVAKISMIVFAILSGLGFILSMPLLSGLGFMFLFGSMMIQGSIWALNKIATWKKEPELDLELDQELDSELV